MTAKLTLTIEKEVIDSAKAYARKKGESLSGIVENYLKSITTHAEPKPALPVKVANMMGVIKLPESFDYKKNLVRHK
jgi:hypothetical protein